MAIALERDHTGNVRMVVNGQPASAAKFNGVSTMPDGTQHAVFVVPLANVVFTEADNVLPFVRPTPAVHVTPTVHVT